MIFLPQHETLYSVASAAIMFYQTHGFSYIEVPWVVSKEAYYATKPPDASDFKLVCEDEKMSGFPVASGEQSFIELHLQGKRITKHCCATPCFRAENDGRYHQPYFFKVELIDTDMSKLDEMIEIALKFHQSFDRGYKVIQLGEDLFDIISKDGIEVGSYGKRTFNDFSWVYGTGLALPRFNQTCSFFLEKK